MRTAIRGDEMINNKILVVDDNQCTNEVLSNFLINDGFYVECAFSGEEALAIFDASIDLVVLDIMLPKISGIDVLKSIRSKSDVPIIMLTSVDDEFTQLQSFDNQADEYVTKPFSPTVMVKRIKAILNRANKSSVQTATINEFVFEFDKYIVSKDNNQIQLTTKEIEIIKILYDNDGRVITRQQLLDKLFGYDYYALDRTIDTHVKNIRKKLGNEFITTVKGVGYKIDLT